MYPWLLGGTLSVGGNSTRPTNLKSFCGGFVNMVFIVSSMLSGACATPEFLMYMNYFIEQEYGEDYYTRADEVVDLSKKRRTIDKMITCLLYTSIPGPFYTEHVFRGNSALFCGRSRRERGFAPHRHTTNMG